MSAFPGATAQVYYNEAGEPLGWDYPMTGGEPDPDPYDDYDEPFKCKCGEHVYIDSEGDMLDPHETCTSPDWFREQFPNAPYPKED